MPIDSRNKRASVMGSKLRFLVRYADPSGTFDQSVRQQTLGLYAGILSGGPSTSVPGTDWRVSDMTGGFGYLGDRTGGVR